MLWSVYWHVQQTKTVEGFPGHVSCCGGRINMCRPDGSCWFGVGGATLGLLIVCGPRLMVMWLWRGPQRYHPRRFLLGGSSSDVASPHYGRPSGNGLWARWRLGSDERR